MLKLVLQYYTYISSILPTVLIVSGNSPYVTIVTKSIDKAPSGHVIVDLECQARGQPEPELQWQHNSIDVTNQATLEKRSDGLTVIKIRQIIPIIQCHKNSLLNRTVVCALPAYTCLASYPPKNGDLPGFARISAARLGKYCKDVYEIRICSQSREVLILLVLLL